jgi:hypothetical protein
LARRAGSRRRRSWVHAEDDPHLLLVNLDPLDEQADDLPAAVPVGLCQPIAYACSKHFEVTQEETHLLILAGQVSDLAELLLQVLQPFPRLGDAGLKLLLVE